jgi:hypothetical protein
VATAANGDDGAFRGSIGKILPRLLGDGRENGTEKTRCDKGKELFWAIGGLHIRANDNWISILDTSLPVK